MIIIKNLSELDFDVSKLPCIVPSAPPSCEVIAIYAQSNGTLSGIMTSWTQSEVNPSIIGLINFDVE